MEDTASKAHCDSGGVRPSQDRDDEFGLAFCFEAIFSLNCSSKERFFDVDTNFRSKKKKSAEIRTVIDKENPT